MTRPTLRPDAVQSTTSSSDEGDQRLSHDAFGKIRVTKTMTGGGVQLFGSELKHHATVNITLSRATCDRHLSSNWIHDVEDIVEFSMSEAQWAHFVSSQGNYTGTPVTLEYAPPRGTGMKGMPHIELEGFIKTFDREIQQKTKQYVADIQSQLAKLTEMANGPKAISKPEFKALTRSLEIKLGNLPSNMAFIQSQLKEAVETTVSDGKIELEAFTNNLAHKLGMDQIRMMAPQITDNAPRPLDAIQIAEQKALAEKPSPYYCAECHEPQYDTLSGYVCKNGHGGADGYTKEHP